MPDANSAYSHGGDHARGPPPSTAAGPSLTTSVYETRLGPVALTWTRTAFGLCLRVDNRLDGGDAAGGDSDEEEGEEMRLRFRVRLWFFWKRRGSKQFHLKDQRRRRSVNVIWDLSSARFHAKGGPEPASGFFVAITVNGEMLLVSGDLVEEAYKKTKSETPSKPSWKPVLISRREHAALEDVGGRRSYRTWALFGRREREITIEIVRKGKDKEAGMAVAVDGDRVLQIRRLRWKFRGSEKLDVEGGGSIIVSWDLHDWLFRPRESAASGTSSSSLAAPGHAVFVFRFEPDEWNKGAAMESLRNQSKSGKWEIAGYSGQDGSLSESSIGGERARRGRRNRSLLKMSSSASSTSSASSAASGSTVTGWTSQEEVDLQQSAEGFSLVVNAWKR